MTASPAERRLQKQFAANTRWAYTENRTAATAPGRAAADARFEKLVDPDGLMTPEVRKRNAENARKAFYQAIAAKSVAARKRRRPAA